MNESSTCGIENCYREELIRLIKEVNEITKILTNPDSYPEIINRRGIINNICAPQLRDFATLNI